VIKIIYTCLFLKNITYIPYQNVLTCIVFTEFFLFEILSASNLQLQLVSATDYTID